MSMAIIICPKDVAVYCLHTLNIFPMYESCYIFICKTVTIIYIYLYRTVSILYINLYRTVSILYIYLYMTVSILYMYLYRTVSILYISLYRTVSQPCGFDDSQWKGQWARPA